MEPPGYEAVMSDDTSRAADPKRDALREEVAIEHVTQTLAAEYAPDHSPDEVSEAVSEAREKFTDPPIRDFVPNLVERAARERLAEGGGDAAS